MKTASAGTPAVAFRVGKLTESIVPTQTGLLADDYGGFVDSLRTLLGSEALRLELGRAARARASLFSWDDSTVSLGAVLAAGPSVEAVEEAVLEEAEPVVELA